MIKRHIKYWRMGRAADAAGYPLPPKPKSNYKRNIGAVGAAVLASGGIGYTAGVKTKKDKKPMRKLANIGNVYLVANKQYLKSDYNAIKNALSKIPKKLKNIGSTLKTKKEKKTMRKLAYWAPFKSKNLEEHKSAKGYIKEYGNRIAGSAPGTAAYLAGLGLALRAARTSNLPLALTGGGLSLGGVGASLHGDYKAIRKSDRAAGAKETSVGRFIGRRAADLGGGMIVPLAGNIAGDALVRNSGLKRKRDK